MLSLLLLLSGLGRLTTTSHQPALVQGPAGGEPSVGSEPAQVLGLLVGGLRANITSTNYSGEKTGSNSSAGGDSETQLYQEDSYRQGSIDYEAGEDEGRYGSVECGEVPMALLIAPVSERTPRRCASQASECGEKVLLAAAPGSVRGPEGSPRAPNCPPPSPTATTRAGIRDVKPCCAFCFCSLGSSGSRQTTVSYKIVIEGKTYTVNLMQKGLLQFENVSYGIEPLEPSIGFEHVIYQVKHRNAGISLYAEKETESREMPYKIQSVEECEALPQVCCNRATCQLSGNSVCDTGPCCEACAYKLSGEMCRPASNECDLPEFCNGSSASCQDDFYVQNGHPCEDNQWICLEGNCMSGAIQCTHIFGEGSSFAGQECYEDLNSKGDQSGNCGATASGYTKCEPKDLKCGKLICTYDKTELINIPSATIVYANIKGHLCVALDYAFGDKASDNMWVCKNKTCVDSAFLNYDCTPEKCNNQGVSISTVQQE
ncbi:hypothetical protein CB1_000667004 [Camelus ferus]|nr:hypothetical protein CB1_000667004 [Camelus ferus]